MCFGVFWLGSSLPTVADLVLENLAMPRSCARLAEYQAREAAAAAAAVQAAA